MRASSRGRSRRSPGVRVAWLAGVLLVGARFACAEVDSGPFSASVSVVSDYMFRGFSQTKGAPALQAGMEYAGASGWVVGAWTSSVDFVGEGAPPDGADVEVDLYLTHGWNLSDRVSLDTTLVRYAYPGTLPGIDYDYNELILALHAGDHISTTVVYTNDAFGQGAPALLGEISAQYPLPGSVELCARAGWYGLDRAFGDDYAYYGLGASRDFGRLTLDARYEGADRAGRRLWGDDAEGRFVVALTARF